MYRNLSRKSNLSISSSDGKQCFRYGKICCYRRKVWCDSNSKISGRELALGIILSALQEYVSLNKHGRQWETLSECCCHRKAWAASAQSFTLWQQTTMEITRRDHSIIAFLCHKNMGVDLHAHPVRGESHIQLSFTYSTSTDRLQQYKERKDDSTPKFCRCLNIKIS